jgi:hypothetical protein
MKAAKVPGDPFLSALAGRGLRGAGQGDNIERNTPRPRSRQAGRQWSAPTG